MDKVLVTGATGVLGRRVAHALVGAGYDVTGVARTSAKRAALAARKVRPVELDLFDRAAVAAAVAGHDVVLHLATAIPVGERANDPAAWAENDRIRREGTRHLVDAAIAAGVRRFVQESIAFVYADGGEDLLDESARVVATGVTASARDAEAETDRFTSVGRTGVALRFGQFYGHDSAHTVAAIHAARAGEPVELGDPMGYRSCVTTDDAAVAVVAALNALAGVYNVVDDRPLRRDAGDPAASMDPDALTYDFLHHRPRLFGIAYRMLGSAWDAEDVVADAMVRWMSVDRPRIREPVAFLTTVVTRLAIDRLRSARAARETYVGEWLPEPVATDADRLGPLDTVERRETVSLATLRMMESLTPPERAVLVLHEAFELSHAEIAAVIGISEVGARQHLRRARRRLERGADVADRSTHDEALDRFLTALEHGHLSEVQDLLAADVASYSDGGGKAHAARRPVVGAAAVVHYLDRLRHRLTVGDVDVVDVNGWPAATLAFGRQRTVLALDVRGDGVGEIQCIMNPDKLRYLGDQLSASRAISPRSRRLESTGTGRFRRT